MEMLSQCRTVRLADFKSGYPHSSFFVAAKTFYVNHVEIAVIMVILLFSRQHRHSKS